MSQPKDPIQIMNNLKAQNSKSTKSTDNLNARNQEFNTYNEILTKQDQLMRIKNNDLNNQLSDIKDLENNIINKDRLIEQTQGHIEKNDNNIQILYVSLGLSLIIFVSIILYAMGKMNDKILGIVVTFVILIFVLKVMYNYNILHFASLVHFLDNRRNLRIGESISNFNKEFGLQQRLYGDKQDFIDQNCVCPESEDIYTDEENTGVDIKPGYFYYDKNAPKQILIPDGGDKVNVSKNTDNPIYDKIHWVDHDKKASDTDFDVKSYKIDPNNYDVYKDGKLVNDSTYSVNL